MPDVGAQEVAQTNMSILEKGYSVGNELAGCEGGSASASPCPGIRDEVRKGGPLGPPSTNVGVSTPARQACWLLKE